MKKILSAIVALILVFALVACDGTSSTPVASYSPLSPTETETIPSPTLKPSSPPVTPSETLPALSPAESFVPASTASTPPIGAATGNYDVIVTQLKTFADNANPGPTKDYFYTNGNADINQSSMPAVGQVSFTSDSMGRASVAKASLTYGMFKASAGSRQGSPLDPPTGWPANNPEIAINYSMTKANTGQPIVYHGYMWNRSHSIADSLAGAQSYTSDNNFTTGTRPQNVGADQHGGMRAAEEVAENYWKSHPDSTTTIYYQVTPVYNGNELIPRGSVVDIISSDGTINTEIVVINCAEGWTINYYTGETVQSLPTTPSPSAEIPSPSEPESPQVNTSEPTSAPDSIELISITSPVNRGATAKVSIAGTPNTQYTITVYYSSGASTASGLEPKMSDASGKASWSWKIGTRTTQKSHYLVISGGGQSLTVDFTVQ